ncbi:MAG: hypothetical protein JXR37_27490, partial [Kiritimatiellae bacterium]|nr:hypothetical protein [Kiritimatiellia bacterium]
GSKDVQKSAENTSMPAEARWEVLKLLPPGETYFLWLDNADHFCFADNPKAWLLPSRARADAQRITRAMTLLLSDHYLKQKPEAKSRLNGSYANTLCGRVITNVTWLTPWTPAPASRKTGETREGSLTHDGLTRTYRLYIPASRDEAVPAPLLMALHGGLGDAERMEQLTQRTFNALADRDGFVVVYPEGIERHWNDGRRNVSYRAHKEKIDDVGFLCALIDRLVSEWNADPARIYMTGASNGAMLTQRFAFEHAERVAAIAPVMGTIPLDLVGTCEPAAPVPVLIINGTDDPLVPWAGGEIGTQRRKIGKGVSIPEAVQFWATRNGCAAQPETALLPDACPEDGTRVKRDIYRARTGDADAVLYTIEGGGHTWPGGWQYLSERLVGRTCRDIDACELIWAFFRGHSRAGVVVPRAGTRGPARVRTRTPFGKSVD